MAENNGVFPELVLDIGPAVTRTASAPPASPLAQTVEAALREVLAWRPKSADPKSFVAALNQAFTISEVDGHTEFAWTPRSYAIQADMGAVTGAQASIYARAKAALDQSVPLLEGLFPLRADDDEEDVEAIRAVVIGKFTELVNELGLVGGPRLPRVEDYFHSLLGPGRPSNPELVAGLLGQMREEFGLQRELVNTIHEEQNLTNYLIAVDHVIALQRSWGNLKHFFDHTGTDVFLGTQLVELSRQLAVVAESVQELYFIMDSVFLGAAERQTIRLRTGLTIDELFSWVERFTTEEAPNLIRDGGKDGVIAFRSTVTKLNDLVKDAWDQAQNGGSNPQRGFHHQRTVAALEEVSRHMQKVDVLTDQLRRLPRPDIQSINPGSVTVGVTDQQLVINGNAFQVNAEAWLTRAGPDDEQGPIGRVNFVSPTTLLAYFDLREQENQSLAGYWTVVVRNPDGGLDWKEQALTIDEEDDTDSTPAVTPLQVTEIAFLPASGRAHYKTLSTQDEPVFTQTQPIQRIRITLNKALKNTSEAVNALFVQRDQAPFAGQVEARSHEIRFIARESLPPGEYMITLIGSGAAGLTAQDGARLNSGADSIYRFEITRGGEITPVTG